MAHDAVFVQRPQRWDVPFDPGMGEADVDRLLAVEPFRSMDPARFPASTPLRGILRNDARVVRSRAGDLLVREGDYGSSAFFILAGAVRVAVEALPAAMLGRQEVRRRGWLSALAQAWRTPRIPEGRELRGGGSGPAVGSRADEHDGVRVFLQDVPAVLDRHRTVRLEAGEIFGELAALGRTPRTATVFAEGEAELLELRWQGLRELRQRDPALREWVDRRYRERSLATHLRETPLLDGLDEAALAEVARQTVFESYGRFDWHGTYRSLIERSPEERLADEPVIAEEGHYPNGLILIRAGFARSTRRFGHGERTLGYLGRGGAFGFDELARAWRGAPHVPLESTLRAVGYVDVLRIPTPAVERHVLPTLAGALQAAGPRVDPAPGSAVARVAEPALDTPTIEFLVDQRRINGTAAMVIDLERCTRCDDCVRACAMTHDGNPRFVRQGPTHGRLLVAGACMHCIDPVCMIGCPTGAIHRNPTGGQVVINDDTCVGCSTCAQSCPYENIRMVEIRDAAGRPLRDRQSGLPILKATKCDLCATQLGGPACQRACPHDALVRIDLTQPDPLARWLAR